MKAQKTTPGNSLLVLPPGVEVSAVGMKITGKLSFQQWHDMMERLQAVHHSILWVIGDGLVWGEDAFGQEFSQVIGQYSQQTLYNAFSVAKKVPIYRRSVNLSWSHHAEVASLPADKQDEFLKLAVKERLKVHELRQKIRISKLIEDRPQREDFHDDLPTPEIPPDPEPEFQEVAEARHSYYTETTEHVRADFIPPSPLDPEKEFRHLFGLVKALRLAEKERDDKTAVRLRTSLDIFLSQHERREERAGSAT